VRASQHPEAVRALNTHGGHYGCRLRGANRDVPHLAATAYIKSAGFRSKYRSNRARRPVDAGEAVVTRVVKWIVVEEVTVSAEGVTPAYRVSTEDEFAGLPEPWLAARLNAFERCEDAVDELRAVQRNAFA